jgi:hypothetical protein
MTNKVPYTHSGIAQVIRQAFFHKNMKRLERQAIIPIPAAVIAIACAAVSKAMHFDRYADLAPTD